MAKVLDAQLFKMAPSFGSYTNKDTLQLRIRLLAMKIGKSVEENKKNEIQRNDSNDFDDIEENNTPCISNPGDSLDECQRNCQRCNKYFTEKTRRVEEKYASMRCHELYRITGIDTFNEMMELVTKIQKIRAQYTIEAQSCCMIQTEMDNEVRRIFLRTPLIDAVKRVGACNTSTVDMKRVHDVQWDSLIAEAKENVLMYEMRTR